MARPASRSLNAHTITRSRPPSGRAPRPRQVGLQANATARPVATTASLASVATAHGEGRRRPPGVHYRISSHELRPARINLVHAVKQVRSLAETMNDPYPVLMKWPAVVAAAGCLLLCPAADESR